MNIRLNTLSEMVAVRLGDYPDYKSGGWTASGGSPLSELVSIGLQPLATASVAALPLKDCSHLKDFSQHLHTSTDWGLDCIYCCKLPVDFMRLHSLRMADWPAPLSEESPGDRLLAALGDRAPKWMLRPLTPMLYVTPDSYGEGANLWFGPTSTSQPITALYVPRPVYEPEEGMLYDFQPEALLPLTDRIADIIREADS